MKPSSLRAKELHFRFLYHQMDIHKRSTQITREFHKQTQQVCIHFNVTCIYYIILIFTNSNLTPSALSLFYQPAATWSISDPSPVHLEAKKWQALRDLQTRPPVKPELFNMLKGSFKRMPSKAKKVVGSLMQKKMKKHVILEKTKRHHSSGKIL